MPESVRKPLIMVVDDHPRTLPALLGYLAASLPECSLAGAESAERALELCLAAAPNIVIMDIMLPGMNGLEATRRIRERLPDTCVVILSGHDFEVYGDESIKAGASAFVGKQRAVDDLVPVILGLLSRSLHQAKRELQIDVAS